MPRACVDLTDTGVAELVRLDIEGKPTCITGPVSYGRGAVLPGAWSSPAAALDMARTGLRSCKPVDSHRG
jgi:hypothetical protein